MLIRDGEKYGFDDLMLVPKPSSLSSRSEVKLETTYS